MARRRDSCERLLIHTATLQTNISGSFDRALWSARIPMPDLRLSPSRVRCGSFASFCQSAQDFRSSPGSGHRHARSACLKSANNGSRSAKSPGQHGRGLPTSTNQFDLARSPSLGEKRFERAIETQDREPALLRISLYPVAALAHRDRFGEDLLHSCIRRSLRFCRAHRPVRCYQARIELTYRI